MRLCAAILTLLACSRSVREASKADVAATHEVHGISTAHAEAQSAETTHVETHTVVGPTETIIVVEEFEPSPDGGPPPPPRKRTTTRMRTEPVASTVVTEAKAAATSHTEAQAIAVEQAIVTAHTESSRRADTRIGPPWWVWPLAAAGAAGAIALVRRFLL